MHSLRGPVPVDPLSADPLVAIGLAHAVGQIGVVTMSDQEGVAGRNHARRDGNIWA